MAVAVAVGNTIQVLVLVLVLSFGVKLVLDCLRLPVCAAHFQASSAKSAHHQVMWH
jgi:hypothetical protein